MSFLTPLFLWLLPLMSIPVIIHLLNRRNVLTINFSSIRFLKFLEKESIRKLQLLQILLMFLRAIIILFLVLMITRPIIKGVFNRQNSAGSRLHVIILDDSFSMMGNEKAIINTAHKILIQIPEKDQLIWININGGLQFKGLRVDVPPIKTLCNLTYHSGLVANILHIFSQIKEDDYTSRELYLLTDSQLSSISEFQEQSDKLKSWFIYLFIAPQIENNLSITQLNLLNEILLPNENFEIETSVHNGGAINKENVLLQLNLNDIIVGQQLISLESNALKTFVFKTALPKSGIHKGMIELDPDDKKEDNRFYFTLNIPVKHNIAIISSSTEGTYYIKESLEALNKFGEILSISEYINLEDQQIDLFEKDIIFILNPDILSTISDSKVEEYLYNGGHIVLFPDVESESSELSNINKITSNIAINYIDLEKESLSEISFQEIDPVSIQINDIQELFGHADKKGRNIRIFNYIPLPFHAEVSKIQLKNGTPIWNRHTIHAGILDVFGFAVNLNWTNFPIKGTFLPFTHFLLYSQNANKKRIYKNTGDTWEHVPSEYYEQPIYHIHPNGSKEILISNNKNIISVKSLDEPGYHLLHTSGIDIAETTVNIIDKELHNILIDIQDVKNYIPNNAKVISMETDVFTEIKEARIGFELWRYFLYGTILLLILEMIISNAKKQR